MLVKLEEIGQERIYSHGLMKRMFFKEKHTKVDFKYLEHSQCFDFYYR